MPWKPLPIFQQNPNLCVTHLRLHPAAVAADVDEEALENSEAKAGICVGASQLAHDHGLLAPPGAWRSSV